MVAWVYREFCMVWSNRGKSERAKISDRGTREDPRPTVDLRNERFRPVAFVCSAGRLERIITDEVMTSDLRQFPEKKSRFFFWNRYTHATVL